MNSKELVLFSAIGEEVPRIPVVPLIGIHAARISRINPIEALFKSSEKQANSLIYAFNYYKYDGIFHYMDLTVEAEAIGCKIEEKGGVPTVVKGANIDEVEKNLPLNPKKDGRLHIFSDTIRRVRELRDIPVGAYITGPFTLTGHLMGVDTLMLSLLEDEEYVKEVMDVCTDLVLPYLDELVDSGADIITILEPTASSSIISPEFFKKFVVRYVKKIVKSIYMRDVLSCLHICGNTTPIIEDMCDTKANILSIDGDVDIMYAIKKANRKNVAIFGNIHPTRILLDGNTEDVRNAVKGCIKVAHDTLFILSSGCEVPYDAPEENILEMVKIAKTMLRD